MSGGALVEQRQGHPALQWLPPRLREPKRWKGQFEQWVARQPVAVDAAIATVTGSFQGAAMGGVMGSLFRMDPGQLNAAAAQSGQNADMLKSMQAQMGGPLIQARNFAVITGVHAGISTAVRRVRQKDDTYTQMVASFGSGFAFSMVSGITQGNPLQGAFTTGVMFALFQGALHKLGSRFSAPKRDPVDYLRGRQILTNLGFPEYTKNIQKGRLNDFTIWLWNDSALQEVRIPPGPRLLILNHVDRYRASLKPPPARPLPAGTLPAGAAPQQQAPPQKR